MSKLNNLRPWYADEIANALKAIAMVARTGKHSDEFIAGFIACLEAICAVIGINESDLR